MIKIGVLKVQCAWVNDNAFYWHCEEYDIETKERLFRKDKRIETLVKIHKIGDISNVFELSEKLSWKYKIFNVELDKTKL